MNSLKLVVTLVLSISCISANQTTNNTSSLDIFNILNSLVPQLPKWTPKMDQLLRLPVQALFALPEVSVAQTINQVCKF